MYNNLDIIKYDYIGFFGIITPAIIYISKLEGIIINIRRIITGSILKYSPKPSQTPSNIPFVR